MLTSLLSKRRRLLEDIAAARRTQQRARDNGDLYLEMAATGRIDFALDTLLKTSGCQTDSVESNA